MLLCGEEVRVRGPVEEEVEDEEKVELELRERREEGERAVRRERRGVKDWKRLGRVECILIVMCGAFDCEFVVVFELLLVGG